MSQPALRLRLLVGSTLSISLALVIAGFALATLFSDHVERSLVDDLNAQLNRLVALIDTDRTAPTLTQSMPDPRYEQPLSGLYWQIRDTSSGATATSRSLWDAVISPSKPLPADGSPLVERIPDPDGSAAIATARRLVFDAPNGGTRTLEVVVAETTRTLDAANAAFRDDLSRDLAILGAALVLAAWVQVTLGLAPLSAIRKGVSAVRSGESKRLAGSFPVEVLPLVNEVNALLDTQETSIAFARARASDLAHGLKTNLTVLNVEAQELRKAGNEKSAIAIEELTQDLARTIDHQLALSRLRHRSRGEVYQTPLRPQIVRVIDTLNRTPLGSALDWSVDVSDDVGVDIDPPDLTELLGVLLENATKWARRRIEVAVVAENGGTLTIEDDGPGLTPEQITRLDSRGRRLDEQKSGTGIGISIAREIVTLNAGALAFDRSIMGGLAVRIRLPGMRCEPQ